MKIIMQLFKKKENKKNKKLLEDFEEGKVLQVDNNVDNKEFLKQK
jgi:hypothetical protein